MKQDALYGWNFCVILNMFLCCINKVLNIKIRSFVLFYLHKALNPDISNPDPKLFSLLFLACTQLHVALSYLWLDNHSTVTGQQHQHHKPAPNLQLVLSG